MPFHHVLRVLRDSLGIRRGEGARAGSAADCKNLPRGTQCRGTYVVIDNVATQCFATSGSQKPDWQSGMECTRRKNKSQSWLSVMPAVWASSSNAGSASLLVFGNHEHGRNSGISRRDHSAELTNMTTVPKARGGRRGGRV